MIDMDSFDVVTMTGTYLGLLGRAFIQATAKGNTQNQASIINEVDLHAIVGEEVAALTRGNTLGKDGQEQSKKVMRMDLQGSYRSKDGGTQSSATKESTWCSYIRCQ
jgi:hypothetical protein